MKKYLNQQDMKDINTSGVFRLIRRAGPITRRQIEAAIDLSWGAISNATALLLREGYIREVPTLATGAGRTPGALEADRENHLLLGLDVNRSGLAGVVTDLTGAVLYRTEREPSATGREEWIDSISDVIRTLLAFAAERSVLAVGIAMQGAVDSKNGVAANFPAEGWENVPLADLLAERFSLPVYLEHDPDCILYAASAQHDLQDAILLRIDKGVGMAVMMDGKIFKRFGAFEVGDIPFGAGRLADAVTLTGIEARARLPFQRLIEAAANGEEFPLAILREAGEALGVAIDTLAGIFNIRDFLLCGKMTDRRDLIAEAVQTAAGRLAARPPLQIAYTRVEQAAVGAALLAIERHQLHFD